MITINQFNKPFMVLIFLVSALGAVEGATYYISQANGDDTRTAAEGGEPFLFFLSVG